MYIENRDIDIIENKYSSLPICSRLPVHHRAPRVGSNLRRSSFFFLSSLFFYSLFLPLSRSLFFQSLCFLFPIFLPRLFFNNPPILSLSRIDQNPADRIKSISASFAARRPNSVRFQPRKSRSMRNGRTNVTQRDPETHERLRCPPVFASGQTSLHALSRRRVIPRAVSTENDEEANITSRARHARCRFVSKRDD